MAKEFKGKRTKTRKRNVKTTNQPESFTIESNEPTPQTDTIFSNNFDFLIFKMLNILTANDKPFFFILPPLCFVLLNFYLNWGSPLHFSFVVFFAYQYVCGNSYYTFFKNAIFYFGFVGVATYFYLKR